MMSIRKHVVSALPLTLALASPAFGQQPLKQLEPVGSPASGPVGESAASVTAEGLRGRIHKMRMDLLLGGDRVREAESQAIGFYREKADFVDRRIDTLGSDLSEKRATYDVVLERALSSDSADDRVRALKEAQPIRGEITVLENERNDLSEKRDRISGLISSVSARDRDRQRLVELVESNEEVPDALGLGWPGIGLAPPPIPIEAGSPLEDDSLLTDLLDRDPLAARSLLFDVDPDGYWSRFPLNPPVDVVIESFSFPLPDLPQQR